MSDSQQASANAQQLIVNGMHVMLGSPTGAHHAKEDGKVVGGLPDSAIEAKGDLGVGVRCSGRVLGAIAHLQAHVTPSLCK